MYSSASASSRPYRGQKLDEAGDHPSGSLRSCDRDGGEMLQVGVGPLQLRRLRSSSCRARPRSRTHVASARAMTLLVARMPAGEQRLVPIGR